MTTGAGAWGGVGFCLERGYQVQHEALRVVRERGDLASDLGCSHEEIRLGKTVEKSVQAPVTPEFRELPGYGLIAVEGIRSPHLEEARPEVGTRIEGGRHGRG